MSVLRFKYCYTFGEKSVVSRSLRLLNSLVLRATPFAAGSLWENKCLHFGTPGNHFGTSGAPWGAILTPREYLALAFSGSLWVYGDGYFGIGMYPWLHFCCSDSELSYKNVVVSGPTRAR